MDDIGGRLELPTNSKIASASTSRAVVLRWAKWQSWVGHCRLLADAEVLEDVVEGFLGSDLAARDFGKNVEGLAKIFRKEVAA